jgi:hypothetical protein
MRRTAAFAGAAAALALLLCATTDVARAAQLGANCNCYCCASGDGCTPVHVGTVSVGKPADVNATCDQWYVVQRQVV